ncbi:gas vesicle protein K [Micromonospora sp. DR5-3]|uniref:gas vesicle protein K n=1 Tax=unclassified Micromonospora TaxID=2617518 RepID=UPI001CA3619E|nr:MULTISPECIES: gas vesicle protein K [unclassified Micromonospora]MCW3819412.1 gas vesicle protein K [Micromonospora sp. DR5-3]
MNVDPENAGAGLGRLVVVLLDVIRQLLERQALRRVDDGDLTPQQVERLGQALLALDRRFAELREIFQDSDGEFEVADPQPTAGRRTISRQYLTSGRPSTG